MKLTRHQRIELIRLRCLKRRGQVKKRSLAQLREYPVLARDDGSACATLPKAKHTSRRLESKG